MLGPGGPGCWEYQSHSLEMSPLLCHSTSLLANVCFFSPEFPVRTITITFNGTSQKCKGNTDATHSMRGVA